MSPCSDFHSVLSEHPILIFGLTPCTQTFLQILWIVWYLFICTVDVNMFKFFWQILPLYALFIPSNITDPSLNNLIICKCTYSCFFLMLLTFPVLCWPSHKFLWSCLSFIYRLCYLTNNIFQTHLSADFLWIKIPLLDPQFYLFRLFEWYNVFSGTLLRTPRKPEWEALMVLNHHKKLKSCLISDF